MEEIKRKVEKLVKLDKKEEIVKRLQEINKLFLTDYMLKLNDLCIYPIEVEAYYHNCDKNFCDPFVYLNVSQKNNFGKLYCHRSGMDVCLSDSENYYFGLLIRAAYIKDEENVMFGPKNIKNNVFVQYKIIQHVEPGKTIKETLEEIDPVITKVKNDLREKVNEQCPVFNTTRFGLKPKEDDFSEFIKDPLRSFIELQKHKPYKWPSKKEEAVETYIIDNINKIGNDCEKIKNKIIELLEYDSPKMRERIMKCNEVKK